MGGGGLSMGADNLVPQYVTNSSVLKSENLMSLNSFDAEKKDPAKTDIHHKTPIGVGISISRYLNNRFSLQTGARPSNCTQLTIRRSSGSNTRTPLPQVTAKRRKTSPARAG